MTPDRLTRPSVGLIPTVPKHGAGETIEPSVSVPIATAQRLAATATPEPELDPDGVRSRAYGLRHCPPRPLQPLDDRVERKFAHSERFALPSSTAPAARSRSTRKASRGGVTPESASDPAVLCIRSRVATLSFTSTGMPWSGPRGPLHGIPVLVKDNVATRDRMQSTAGSLALSGVTPPRDAFLVERLRAAGAVLLGKANLSEWANFRSTRSSSGWSGRGGQCRNPYALDRTPCGSSSGSGVAVSANLCAVAIGTATDGSIVCPSTMCGIVGLKPTVGPVSPSGIGPILQSQDDAELTVLLYELKADLNRYLAGVEATPVRTLAEVIAFNRAHADHELRWFGQDLFEQAEAKGPLTDKAYLDARAKCVRLSREEG